MNTTELYLLGHRLQKLAEAAIPTEGVGEHPTSTRTVLLVAADVREHPGTTVTEIARRTGLVQSQVSNAVARLRGAGGLAAAPDPADRRRTLLRPGPDDAPRVVAAREAPLGPVLAAATTDPERAAVLLEELVGLFRTVE
ncbi:MarR family transcriptional regulator [Actinomadura parmotrematis]|uniref:MarR family transcriptional regulator n=1 Tax=Actinomadura parmotrematis TaxID=2864039 RepID=A0ABS7G3Y6_9ACTN|nr:MarR family transcriptional regulator [Actinomadura parmotrematis]MBW8487408.1 MarR family transcriptional regulator [Actinomadura parmotrematis]